MVSKDGVGAGYFAAGGGFEDSVVRETQLQQEYLLLFFVIKECCQ